MSDVIIPDDALDAPDSDGWWWCIDPRHTRAGDELCLEVHMNGQRPVVHYGRDCDYIQPASGSRSAWFVDMKWIKAVSPFQTPCRPTSAPQAGYC